jgi:coenzyme Q-binding protein COQ10
MPKASVKRLIECKKDQLIDLVLEIEKYPEFVPFCLGSHVYEKKKKAVKP